MKTCSKCKVDRPIEEFFKRSASKDGYQSRCKACSGAVSTEWSRQNYVPSKRRVKYLARYGLTVEQFEKMVADQEGKCNVCRRDSTYLVVDHCHISGKVRALLCNNCNTALGLVREDVEVLNNLIKYLEGQSDWRRNCS